MADNIDVDKVYTHWIQMSDKDFETMQHLFQSKDFHWALFVGHIVIEKLLKALVVQKLSDHAPFTHDLTRLAKLTELNFSQEHLDWMDTITTFNMNTRYDSYKQLFYQKCTEEYTGEWFEKIQTLRSWIKERQS